MFLTVWHTHPSAFGCHLPLLREGSMILLPFIKFWEMKKFMDRKRNSYNLKMQNKKYSKSKVILIEAVGITFVAIFAIIVVIWLLFPHEAVGLEYRVVADRECKITGKGICIDTDLIIPSNYGRHQVVGIDNNAFYAHGKLKNVVMPNGIAEIGTFAYYNCDKLTSVTIPGSVKNIGISAFNNCFALTKITYQGAVSEWIAISKEYYWDYNTPDYTVYCTDGVVAKDGTAMYY